MIRLLGKSPSINVRKVLWLLAELDLPYTLEQWGTGARPTQEPEFLALNPNALVPVLVDEDFVVWESNTICRYLASRQGRDDPLPAAPRERARVEQWMDWQVTELNNSWRYAFLSLVRRSPQHQDPAQREAGIASWNRHMQLFEDQLVRTQAYAAGARFTLADSVLGLSAHRWSSAPMARPELPAVRAYLSRLRQHPGFLLHGDNGMP